MLAYSQRLESAPWFSVGEQLDGPAAHQRVLAVRQRDATRPYCVYVHVPFCETMCSFCALYTFGVGPNADAVFDRYLDVLLASLPGNPWAGAAQPPTTVHFGGGTPLSLGRKRFSTLVRALKGAFGTSPACEWAIETTTSSLDPETVDALEGLGFRRIHLGIQTLDDATRARLGRRETGARAVERLLMLAGRGFLASVDLIIGFEGVSPRIVEDDLRRLYDAGVRMFSICELRERSAVRLGIRDAGEQARRNYALWRTIWSFMEAAGLPPIHLGQFGRNQADNLYFTHPARGDDCVAIGAYAHGSADDVSYGNRLLPDYYDAVLAGRTPIAMGVDYRAAERVIRTLERELLAHEVSAAAIDGMRAAYGGAFEPIFDRWIGAALLQPAKGGASFTLTADGSWFVGNMIEDARALASAGVQV
jgi:anaerobilin synthase